MRLRNKQVVASALVLAAGTYAANADIVDLTTAGSSGSIGGVWYYEAGIAPTGTGNINSFVRIGGNTSTVHGYNTSGRGGNFNQFNINSSPQFTRNLLLGDIPTVNIGGVNYKEFILDINQNSPEPLLTLSQVAIFTSTTGSLTPAVGGVYTGLGTHVYSMNANTQYSGGTMPTPDNRVELNYNLHSGSGQGDMYMYVPVSMFGAAAATDFVYLYSIFGVPNGNNDGFEEWAVRNTITAPIPLPNIAGLGLVGLGLIAVRRTRR